MSNYSLYFIIINYHYIVFENDTVRIYLGFTQTSKTHTHIRRTRTYIYIRIHTLTITHIHTRTITNTCTIMSRLCCVHEFGCIYYLSSCHRPSSQLISRQLLFLTTFILTLPWTVPSPAEKRGGLGKGLKTLSRKKQIVTKTSTKGTLLNVGEGGPPGESMTPCSESRKEATSPIPFLSSKKISKIGTWNVRTMLEANKAAQIARERQAYNITVLGLCETRWTQSGQVRLNTAEMILYSGHEEEDAHHTEGVAFMLSHEAQNALVQNKEPTNDKDEETKEDFYNKLQTLCDKLKEKDMTILMGDLNAKIGSDNSGYEEVMGRQGLRK